jgi:preprotein translocase subunit YajC
MLNKALFSLALVASLCVLASPALCQSAPAPTAAPAAAPAPARGVEAAPEPRPGSPTVAPAGGQAAPNQTPTTKADPNNTVPADGGGIFGLSPNQLFLGLMILVIVLMFVLNGRTRRKQEAKRRDLLGGMKKGDRVTTIGGVIGTLIEVRETEVIVKIDEQNNTRMRFLKSAIAQVGEPQAEKDPQK